MTNRLEVLEDWAAALRGQLEPASRNRLTRNLGETLRRSQQKRIIAQRNPDGSKYTPRKHRNLRGKQGRVKRSVAMFLKLRTARFLKVQRDANAISTGYTGRIVRIAKVHQYGLKDRAERGASNVVYDKRQLLGLAKTELDMIRDCLLSHLTPQ